MCSIHTCRLCALVNTKRESRKIEDTLLAETDHFEWVPGLGAFVEGYSLIVSKIHVLNTGEFDITVIKELESFVDKVRTLVGQIYNTNTTVFEHGSMGGTKHGGCCVEHHHLHVFPASVTHVPEILLLNFKNHRSINSLEDLKELNQKRLPYIYFSKRPGAHHVFEVSIIPRQYMRQVLAVELGIPQKWDWREHNFMQNVTAFVAKVQNLTSD